MAFLFFQTLAGVGFRAKCITFGLLHAELLKNTFLMISKMDLVLLGFCLISLLITGFIVFLDISRRGIKKLDVPQEELPEFDETWQLDSIEIEKSMDR